MISRICARLILGVGIAALAQVESRGQASIDASQSQFGTEPAPYAQPAQPVDDSRGVPVAQPVTPSGAYAPAGASYAPAAGPYAPAAAGYAPHSESNTIGAPDPSKPLGRGDTVTFSITQDREPPQIMRVTDTGELDFSIFPKIGRVSVVGRTCAQVAAELKRKLEADYYNSADVVLGINQVNSQGSRGRVYVTGNVRGAGPQELPSNEQTMVSTAIIRAGGLDKFANGHKVKVTRKDKMTGKVESFTVDVTSIINGGHRERDFEVMDGDYINVPQNVINF